MITKEYEYRHINITRHARERYCERVKGIADKTERNAYITTNEEIILSHINSMFSHSKFIFRGKIGGDNTTKNFYLHQDIALVVSDDNNLITIFRVNFEFPSDAKFYVINSLVEHILDLEERFKEEKEKVDSRIFDIEMEKEKNEAEIKELETRIKLLKDKNTMLDMEKKTSLQEVSLISSQQQRYAWQLFGNSDYKNDITKK